MHYPIKIYPFSENVHRSAAGPDLGSLGSQACEEREREREREREKERGRGGGGGGVKGSAHFALQILVLRMLQPLCTVKICTTPYLWEMAGGTVRSSLSALHLW